MWSPRHRSTSLQVGIAIAVFAAATFGAQAASRAQEGATARTDEPHDFFGVVGKSLAGDVYDPARWHELSLGSFFTDGWDEAWASGPNGEGGAPRQGWLNAADGVFYRLFLFTFNWAHQDSNDGYVAGLTGYTPLNKRFQFRFDIPFFVSQPGFERETGFGDFQVTPRFLLSETVNFTQSLDLTFRTPTGSEDTDNGIGAFSPAYNFWWNAVAGLVLRGSVGGFVPFSGPDTSDKFTANLAAGYYFTPHDMLPIGDLVWYVATNLNQTTDGEIAATEVPTVTTLTFTPGFRTHLGANFYLLGGVEVPATNPKPFDYQVLAALMKVW
jgi:hypothetical protein